MRYLISYDITSNKQRTRASKVLADYGTRVQFSVFECDLTVERLAEVRKRLDPCVNAKVDSLRIYALCEACARRVLELGVSVPTGVPPAWVV